MINIKEKNYNYNNFNSNNIKSNPAFKKGFTGLTKAADIFIKSQENLSSTRFIQDTATNWAPKALFARSTADFSEMSFLEFIESGIFYFASPILGEKLFRNKLFNGEKFVPKNIKANVNEQIPKTVEEITKNKTITEEIKKRAISKKAGIVLACTAIPVAEYTLSFAKNLFTLKTFNKSNFNNIANLDKKGREKENIAQQIRVEQSAKKHLKEAAVISAAGIMAGAGLALNGHKSKLLLNIAKSILNPGKAIAKGLQLAGYKNEKVKNTISSFSLDFANNNGKLALSKGQLAFTAIVGLFGYSKAAEDRGKLDVLEVWTRVPLVVFYTIVGSELFQKGFEKILEKKNKFPDLLKKNKEGKLVTPKRSELPELAKKLARERGTDKLQELSRLTKQKAFVEGVPYAFSLLFMGLTLSGITRLWTQYRYNHQNKHIAISNMDFLTFAKQQTPEIFKDISSKR